MLRDELHKLASSIIPEEIPEESLLEIESEVERLVGKGGAKTAAIEDLRRLKELLEFKEKHTDVSGFHKWYVPGTPYGIDKLPKHKAFFDATAVHRETLMLGGNRCLLEGTLVATPKGPVAIEDIKQGDLVYDCYGNPTEVVAIWDNGEQEVGRLTNRGKEWLWCTPDHELDCQESRRNKRRLRLRADSIIQETQVRRVFPKAPLGDVEEPHAYVIGAMLGDGCCTCGSSARIVLSSKNSEIPAKVASILGAEYREPSGNYSYTIYSSFNHYDWMEGKLAHEKTVDMDVVKSWDRNSVLNFVAGLIDSDGSMSRGKDGSKLVLHMQSKDVIDAFAYCVLALWNEPVTIAKDSRTKYKNGPVWRAYIRNPHALKRIVPELAPYLVHKYKAELADVPSGARSYPDKIALKLGEERKIGRVYDITVAHEEHFFLLANGLSVSNCGKTRAGATITSILATGDYPDWWEGIRFDHPVSVWAAGKTGQSTRDTVQEAVLGPIGSWGTGALPLNTIGRTTARQGIANAIDTVEVKHVSGGISTIGFKSYDQKPASFYGTAKHLVWLDEPCPELVYNECLIRTMTTGGRLVHTITPKEGLTRLLADFLRDCDMLAGAERIKGLEALGALDDMESVDEYGY